MIYLKLKTRYARLDEASLGQLWKVLGDSPLYAQKYGDVEPVRQSYTRSQSSKGFELLRRRGVIIKGKGGGVRVKGWPVGVANWSFWLDDEVEASAIVDLVEQFARVSSIVYGYACTEAEYDAKHKVVGEHSVARKGVSMWDFQDFLPGIYWLTVFGDELRASLDFSGVESMADVELIEPEGGALMVQLDAPLVPDDMEARLATERNIASHLGRQHFFDLERCEQGEFAHPPAFKEFLLELEQEYLYL